MKISRIMLKTAKSNVSRRDFKGFTIIELLVATSIFSLVLLVILASFLQIGRMFYKGVSVSNTNESARSLLDSITRDVRFGQSPTGVKNEGGKSYFCAGSHRYTFALNQPPTTARTGYASK
jgi:prepilin-type N-terminal cleavage/methylation domain-containing protein